MVAAKKPRKLPSEINNLTMKRRVLAAARKRFRKRSGVKAFFEHGQWWVQVDYYPKYDRIETFSVVDATGPGTVNGFYFEGV